MRSTKIRIGLALAASSVLALLLAAWATGATTAPLVGSGTASATKSVCGKGTGKKATGAPIKLGGVYASDSEGGNNLLHSLVHLARQVPELDGQPAAQVAQHPDTDVSVCEELATARANYNSLALKPLRIGGHLRDELPTQRLVRGLGDFPIPPAGRQAGQPLFAD